MTFSLSPQIKNALSRSGIQELNNLQKETIQKFNQTKNNLLISAGTGSGKTEAILVPITEYLLKNKYNNLQVIYIMPLVALANDQATRVENFFKAMDLNVFKYHGDVSQHKKRDFFKNPCEVLIITPESLQAVLISQNNHIFKTVNHIIIDEVHYFLDNERGNHLYNSISIINNLIQNTRLIGISATVKETENLHSWFNSLNSRELVTITEKSKNRKITKLEYFDKEEDIIKDLKKHVFSKKSIVFFHSKKTLENTAIKLNLGVDKHQILTHHGNLSKNQREKNENLIKTTNNSVCATSTLELGIDIGDVKVIYFFDLPSSVASYLQRIGRSGRKTKESKAKIYCTSPIDTLYAYKIRELGEEGIVEEFKEPELKFTTLSHYILTIIAFNKVTKIEKLKEIISKNIYYKKIEDQDFMELINYMIKKDLVFQKQNQDIILYDKGQSRINTLKYFSFFESNDPTLAVYDEKGKKIGYIDQNRFVKDTNKVIGIAGQKWEIINTQKNMIKVKKSIQEHGIFFESFNRVNISKLVINSILKLKKPFNFENCSPQFQAVFMRKYKELIQQLNKKVVIPMEDLELKTIYEISKEYNKKEKILFDDILVFDKGKKEELLNQINNFKKNTIVDEKKLKQNHKFAENVPTKLLKKEYFFNNYDFESLTQKIIKTEEWRDIND